eukprot:192091-Amphidinium_carterae.1
MSTAGWLEASLWLAARHGHTPDTHLGRHIDQVWLSPLAIAALEDVKVLDAEFHKPVVITLNWDLLQTPVTQWSIPSALPIPQAATDDWKRCRAHAIAHSGSALDDLRATLDFLEDPDLQFKLWSRAAENCLIDAIAHTDPHFHASRRHRGRG